MNTPKKPRKPKSRKPIAKLTDWDWTTLVAAWRYYENRSTIAGAHFPAEIIERYFTGGYSEECCKKIARQFYHVDHGIRGDEDWKSNNSAHPAFDHPASWVKFYHFCRAYCEGFMSVTAKYDEQQETFKAFYVPRYARYYPVDDYLANPYVETYIDPSSIITISGNPAKK